MSWLTREETATLLVKRDFDALLSTGPAEHHAFWRNLREGFEAV